MQLWTVFVLNIFLGVCGAFVPNSEGSRSIPPLLRPYLENGEVPRSGLFPGLMEDLEEAANIRRKDQHETRGGYDFIIVGGGTTGSVLASRLTENPRVRVLLLEAGQTGDLSSQIPAANFYLEGTNHTQTFRAEPTPGACLGSIGGRCSFTTGTGLGGSSLTNNLLVVRGNPDDFNRWEEAGNEGWSYDKLLPYFKKSEAVNLNFPSDRDYRNDDGMWSVETPHYVSRLADEYMFATKELDHDEIDYNGEYQIGSGIVQASTRNGRRHSTASAYLHTVHKNRSNLVILTGAMVKRILIDDNTKTTYGVEYSYQNRLRRAVAVQEVILSAGTFKTPQLLMLSGIGPRDQLKSFGIHCKMDLPVGENLHDHLAFPGITFHLSPSLDLEEYKRNRLDQEEVLTSLGYEAVSFLKTPNSSLSIYSPDIELLLFNRNLNGLNLGEGLWNTMNLQPDIYRKLLKSTDRGHINSMSLIVVPLQPKARGRLSLRGRKIETDPVVSLAFLEDEEDMQMMLQGIQQALLLLETDGLKSIGARLHTAHVPGCERFVFGTEDYWRCAVRILSVPFNDHGGTVKMGRSDSDSVVDSELKVHGIKKLRVVDRSVIPSPISGQIQALAIAIGEKMADSIKKEYENKDVELELDVEVSPTLPSNSLTPTTDAESEKLTLEKEKEEFIKLPDLKKHLKDKKHKHDHKHGHKHDYDHHHHDEHHHHVDPKPIFPFFVQDKYPDRDSREDPTIVIVQKEPEVPKNDGVDKKIKVEIEVKEKERDTPDKPVVVIVEKEKPKEPEFPEGGVVIVMKTNRKPDIDREPGVIIHKKGKETKEPEIIVVKKEKEPEPEPKPQPEEPIVIIKEEPEPGKPKPEKPKPEPPIVVIKKETEEKPEDPIVIIQKDRESAERFPEIHQDGLPDPDHREIPVHEDPPAEQLPFNPHDTINRVKNMFGSSDSSSSSSSEEYVGTEPPPFHFLHKHIPMPRWNVPSPPKIPSFPHIIPPKIPSHHQPRPHYNPQRNPRTRPRSRIPSYTPTEIPGVWPTSDEVIYVRYPHKVNYKVSYDPHHSHIPHSHPIYRYARSAPAPVTEDQVESVPEGTPNVNLESQKKSGNLVHLLPNSRSPFTSPQSLVVELSIRENGNRNGPLQMFRGFLNPVNSITPIESERDRFIAGPEETTAVDDPTLKHDFMSPVDVIDTIRKTGDNDSEQSSEEDSDEDDDSESEENYHRRPAFSRRRKNRNKLSEGYVRIMSLDEFYNEVNRFGNPSERQVATEGMAEEGQREKRQEEEAMGTEGAQAEEEQTGQEEAEVEGAEQEQEQEEAAKTPAKEEEETPKSSSTTKATPTESSTKEGTSTTEKATPEGTDKTPEGTPTVEEKSPEGSSTTEKSPEGSEKTPQESSVTEKTTEGSEKTPEESSTTAKTPEGSSTTEKSPEGSEKTPEGSSTTEKSPESSTQKEETLSTKETPTLRPTRGRRPTTKATRPSSTRPTVRIPLYTRAPRPNRPSRTTEVPRVLQTTTHHTLRFTEPPKTKRTTTTTAKPTTTTTEKSTNSSPAQKEKEPTTPLNDLDVFWALRGNNFQDELPAGFRSAALIIDQDEERSRETTTPKVPQVHENVEETFPNPSSFAKIFPGFQFNSSGNIGRPSFPRTRINQNARKRPQTYSNVQRNGQNVSWNNVTLSF